MTAATSWRENTRYVAAKERDSWQSTSATANDWSSVSVSMSKMLTHSCVSTSALQLVDNDALSLSILLSVATTASTLERDGMLNNFLSNNETHQYTNFIHYNTMSQQEYHRRNSNKCFMLDFILFNLSDERLQNKHINKVCLSYILF